MITTDGPTGPKILAGASSFFFTFGGACLGSYIDLDDLDTGATIAGNFLFGFTIGGYFEAGNVMVQNGISGIYEDSSENRPTGTGWQLYKDVFSKYLPTP